MTPNRNEGGNKGFSPIEEELSTFTCESPEQLGTEVIKAFDKAAKWAAAAPGRSG